MNKQDYTQLQELCDTIESAVADATRLIQSEDRNLYERWKASGKQVTDEFVSMYPNLRKVVETIGEGMEEDPENEDTDAEVQAGAIILSAAPDEKTELEKFVSQWVENEIGMPPAEFHVIRDGAEIVVNWTAADKKRIDEQHKERGVPESTKNKLVWIDCGEDLIEALNKHGWSYDLGSASNYSVTLRKN